MTDDEIDAIANDGMRNAAGGIYATRVHEFARAVLARAQADSQAPVAYLHILHMEGDQTYEQLTFNTENPFGKPGRDYSAEYLVTCTPLHPPSSQPTIAPSVAHRDGDADTARLDYLDWRNQKANERHRTTYGWRLTENHNRLALEDHNFPAMTVRQAIDSAMEEHPRT